MRTEPVEYHANVQQSRTDASFRVESKRDRELRFGIVSFPRAQPAARTQVPALEHARSFRRPVFGGLGTDRSASKYSLLQLSGVRSSGSDQVRILKGRPQSNLEALAKEGLPFRLVRDPDEV